MPASLPILKGRGTPLNPPNRFEALYVEPDNEHLTEEELAAEPASPPTHYFRDTTKSIIAQNDSPDVGFTHSVNPYRGCSHGCIYCYARPGHEFLGMSSGLDFETKIMVKLDAPEQLRKELSSPKWEPISLHFCGVTDCYQPAEKQFRITRQCIEVCAEFRNPISIITKNALVTRDIDILAEMAAQQLVMVILSVTTLDHELSHRMEPRTSVPRMRLEAIRKLTAAGVPTGVMFAPIIPGLTDHETSNILNAAAEAGARFAGYVPLRLPFAIKNLFEDWLERNYPDRKDKVLNRIKSLRGGKLNDPNFVSRMRGEGPWAEQIKTMFKIAKRKAGLDGPSPELTTAAFRRPARPQMTLWPEST